MQCKNMSVQFQSFPQKSQHLTEPFLCFLRSDFPGMGLLTVRQELENGAMQPSIWRLHGLGTMCPHNYTIPNQPSASKPSKHDIALFPLLVVASRYLSAEYVPHGLIYLLPNFELDFTMMCLLALVHGAWNPFALPCPDPNVIAEALNAGVG